MYVHIWNILRRGFLAFIRFSKRSDEKKIMTQLLGLALEGQPYCEGIVFSPNLGTLIKQAKKLNNASLVVSTTIYLFTYLFKFIYFEREHEEEAERSPSRPRIVSMEPCMGLEHTDPKILT